MSSSYYSAEKLGFEITRTALSVIAKSASVSTRLLVEATVAQLPSEVQGRLKESQVQQRIYRLRRNGLIDASATRSSLTLAGYQELNRLEMRRLSLGPNEKWDGRWRIVAYDIPETKRAARSALRRLFKDLGFYRLQKSVWIHPLACEPQIERIKQAYGIGEHVSVFVVSRFDHEKEVRAKFRRVIG